MKFYGMKFYKRIFSYFRPELYLILILMVLILCTVELNLLGPYPIGIFVDLISGQAPKEGWIYHLFVRILPASLPGKIFGLACLLLGIRALQAGLSLARTMINNRIKYNGTSRVRHELEQKLQLLGPNYHQSHTQGDSFYRLSTDTWGFFGVVDVFIGSTIAIVSWMRTLIAILLIDPRLTLIAISVIPAMAFIYSYFGKRIRKRASDSKRTDSILFTTIQRILSAIPLIQVFRRQKKESLVFREVNHRSMEAHMKLDWQENLYPFAIELALTLGTALIFGYGAYQVYRATLPNAVGPTLSLGQLTIFLFYLPQFFDAVTWILGFPTKVKTNNVACERVFTVLEEPIIPASSPLSVPFPTKPRTLSLQNVRFYYDMKRPLLNGVSLRIPPGQIVAFIGPSGAGKSTLLQLLLRFVDPIQGRLTLDGVDFRSISLTDLRKHMALVPQDAGLFPATLFENITYGRENATLEEVREAARRAGASEFIEALPDKYQTLVLEGAQNLSGGQRQRVALARALLTQAPILVLDEPTSALDPLQRYTVLETLKNLKGEQTIIVATHDLDLLEACDQVFFLYQGQILPQGNYKTLFSLPPKEVQVEVQKFLPRQDPQTEVDVGTKTRLKTLFENRKQGPSSKD